MRKLVIVAVLLVALTAIGVLAWSQRRSEPFFVSGLIESDEIRVGSRVGGRVSQTLAAEGQRVTRGQLLLRLEPYDLNERLAQAEATAAAAEAALARRMAGYRIEEIEQARAVRDRNQALLDLALAGMRPLEITILEDQLAVALADLHDAQREHARISGLLDRTQDELDRATTALESAQARAAAAEHELALAREGTRVEQIAEARARLAESQAVLKMLEAGSRAEDIAEAEGSAAAARAAAAAIRRQIEELEIRAPLDAVVEATDLQPGDLVAPGAPVISLSDAASLWVRAYVPENRLNLSIGQRVSVRVDSYPGRWFAGHVSFIARHAEFTPANVQTPEDRSRQVFRIKVQLDEGLAELRPGMSADVFPDRRP
jgi:multidrug resistance efflux pump